MDIGAERIALPGTQTKNKKPHIVHLAKTSIAELEIRSEHRNGSEYVFSTTGITPSSGISKAKRHLDNELGDKVSPWRLHDFRRALASALAETGVPEGVVDRIQNHSASGSAPSAVARIYQQSDLLPQRAAALDRWSEMVSESEAEVVKLRGWSGEELNASERR